MDNVIFSCDKCGFISRSHTDVCPECKSFLSKHAINGSNDLMSFYKSLIIYEKAFAIALVEYFKEKKISYVLDYSPFHVGFKRENEGELLTYLSKPPKRPTRIHLYSLKNKKCASADFDKDKLNKYIEYVIKFLFTENVNVVASESNFNEIKSSYRFAVIGDSIESIKIDSIKKVNGSERVYFVLDNGSKKFCLLSNIKNRLFKTRREAELSVTTYESLDKYFVKSTSSSFNKKYVIVEDRTKTYYAGTHQTKNYETVKQRYRRSAGSFAIVDVPDFTLKIDKAIVFYDYDSAKRIAGVLEEVTEKLSVIEIK